ncbi:hypothetical protein FRC09_020143 [Ceratobasidium sp. 395]|nr:hypothetical protein FRC09_020143 [Ceratobasidium sp. 395]
MPLLTHSDPGTENFGVANAQTVLQQLLNPSLAGTSQHTWLQGHLNIKPKIAWSQIHRRLSEGLEAVLQIDINQGWFNPNNNLELLLFCWLWMPVVQTKLDTFSGHPKYIHEFSTQFGGEQLKISVSKAHLSVAEQEFCEPGHPVFEWIPPNFCQLIQSLWVQIGSPPVTCKFGWTCYNTLLAMLHNLDLNKVISQKANLQGRLQADLQAQLESGSHCGDAWGYGIEPGVHGQDAWEHSAAPIQLTHPVDEEHFDFDLGEAPEYDSSGEEEP